MRNHLARKTLLASKGTVLHWMMAIVGSLVVLSVFMLVFGVTRATAQTGQDPRCSEFRRQAHGLCTAAVSEGCFDGVESQACDDLTTNWNERCQVCEGTAPWEEEEAICPCVVQAGSAVELNEIFEAQTFEGEIFTQCIDNDSETRVARQDEDMFPELLVRVFLGVAGFICQYGVSNDAGVPIESAQDIFTSPDELEACREDIRSLMEQIDCP